MTDPRWSIDENDVDTCLTFPVNGRDERICPWTHALWHEQTVTLDSPAAHDALVAAVRDADTLTQARRLAAKVAELRFGGLDRRRIAEYTQTLTDLLDLLAGDRP